MSQPFVLRQATVSFITSAKLCTVAPTTFCRICPIQVFQCHSSAPYNARPTASVQHYPQHTPPHTHSTELCIEQDHRNFFAYVTCGNFFKIKPTLGSSDQADHHNHYYYKPKPECACAGAGGSHRRSAAVAALHWGAALAACSLSEGHSPGIPPGPTGAACSPLWAACGQCCAEDEIQGCSHIATA